MIFLSQQPNIILDREHTEYKWVSPQEIEKFDIVPQLQFTYLQAQKYK